MYYSAIGLLAAFVLVIINHDVLLSRGQLYDREDWTEYRRFLLAVLAYYFTDILWGYFESKKLAFLLFADTTVYFVTMAIGVYFWTHCTVLYLEDDSIFGKVLVWLGRVVASMITVLAFINVFVPVLFTVDNMCVYRAMPARYVMLAIQITMLILVSVYAIMSIRHRSEKRFRYRTIWVTGLLMALFLIIQFGFPYLPLYSIAYMLCTCLIHTFVIIDEKEETERNLREAAEIAELKESLSSLLHNMPAMTFYKDAETGVYLACNQAFADYAHKASPEGVVGLTDAEIFDSTTAEHFVEDDKLAMSMDKPYIFFEDVPDAAGKHRQFSTTKLKFTDTNGRLCILGMCIDVTEMTRVERENIRTREEYEKARSSSLIYSRIAKTLAQGYTDLFYVNLVTGEFIEYRTDGKHDTLVEERRGWHFFDSCKYEVNQYVYPDDREKFIKAMDRQTLIQELDNNKTFIMPYRLIEGDGFVYVNMKVSRMKDDNDYIIIGVTNIDAQIRERMAVDRLKEERITYARVTALTGDYLCVYSVDPKTEHYREFASTEDFRSLALEREGDSFFDVSRERGKRMVYPDDRDRFLTMFTKENVIAEIEKNGIFALRYRLFINGKPIFVRLKAAMVEERDGARLVIGINDIDAHVRQEEEYERRLAQAQSMANIDALTGVKNKHAYLAAEERLDRQIQEFRHPEFAIVILDVNDLKLVNDKFGHQAGDQYLRDACGVICGIFKHSPVFRIGGDEFAVIVQGRDYNSIEELLGKMKDHNRNAARDGGIVIACGMSKFNGDSTTAEVFERADLSMYDNKNTLKNGGEVR